MRFSRRHIEEPEINLPAAEADRLRERPAEIIVAVASDGRYAVNRRPIDGRSIEQLTAELNAAAAGRPETVVIISADALAAHQSVVNVLDAARRAGLTRLTFAAQGGTTR
jgi:biopolymer transport protein ExbD